MKGEEKIKAEANARLLRELQRIDKLRSEKKLTPEQAGILSAGAIRQNGIEVERELEKFHTTIREKEQQINESLRDAQLKNIEDRLNLIQNEFNRRRELIEFNEEREKELLKRSQEDKLSDLETQKGLISEAAFYSARARIAEEGEQELNNIALRYARQRADLSSDIFLRSLEEFDRAITDAKLINDKAQLDEIRGLVDRFSTGLINYEEYRKQLSAIQDKYDRANLIKQVQVGEEELRVLRRRLNNTLDTTSEEYDKLIALINQKESEVTAARTRLETTGVNEKDDPKVETIAAYADAIGQLTQAVISFWDQANKAESAALDRSIAIQERRVTEAQRIAERGNASYLKMEEDRMKELQIARENAARRQLAIDAALQASQLLVGITGAIADLAKGPAGIAQTIADVAVIVSTLAAGYGLVRSLQSNQPKFYKGTKNVKRTNEPAGIDTIPALLTEGEAVITRDKNKAYHPVVEAIHDGTVPAEFLNLQVKKYHQLKSTPEINYQKVKETTTMHINHEGKLASIMSEQNRKIDENNHLQRQILTAMKNMSVSASIDKNGIAIAVNEYIEKMEIDKRV